MALTVTVTVERWPVAGSFIISRGAKTHVDVILCTLSDGSVTGRAEATPIYYEGESAEECADQIKQFVAEHPQLDRALLLQKMPRAERRATPWTAHCGIWNAGKRILPCGSWLACRNRPQPYRPLPFRSAPPSLMESHARQAAADGYTLLKLKLAGDNDHERVAAVHRGAPAARLIVDANESWNDLDIAAEAAHLAQYSVELIEQPVSAGHDHLLSGVKSPVPLCADESCHTSADIEKIAPYYDAVNIKLDKAGGLNLAKDRDHGFRFESGRILTVDEAN